MVVRLLRTLGATVGLEKSPWVMAAWKEAWEGFCDAVDRGHETWLDPYGAEHEAEFFAVCSESFFVDPQRLAAQLTHRIGQHLRVRVVDARRLHRLRAGRA